jgi:signal transduction histidine kinase
MHMRSKVITHYEPEQHAIMTSFFATAERIPAEQLINFADTCLNNPIVKVVLESVEGIVLILNRHRQILAANKNLLHLLGMSEQSSIIGLRPGELFKCIYAMDGPGGCGTSLHCSTCGAANVILTSQEQSLPASDECMLTINRDGTIVAAEFAVRAAPLRLGDEELTILVLQDISAVKRKDALEKVFFHDVINSLSELKGWSEMLLGDLPDSTSAARHLVRISNRLSDEILGQRLLLQAENGDLVPDIMPVNVVEVLGELAAYFTRHSLARGRTLETAPPGVTLSIVTDKNLLMRVLVNMVKNALEATEHGGTVRVWFALEGGRPGFFVHNTGLIPERVQLQIFQRSFSTRSTQGRGLGTYCMKLFGERYLRGTVSFTSTELAGTTFSILLPPLKTDAMGTTATLPLRFDHAETLPGEELCSLPASLACSLLQAAQAADIDTLQLLVDKAAPLVPATAELLNNHLQRFDYRAIATLLTPYARRPEEEQLPSFPAKESILVVDGDPDMLLLLRELLNTSHYRIRPVNSGTMALTASAALPPDLILLDVHMPDVDGYELCRKFKHDDALRDVPVIFLSAVDEAFDKVRAFRCGAVDYIAKPFQVEELRARIATHLNLRKYSRELKAANNELEAFSYSVSHDLKAPIRQILGFNDALMESHPELLDGEGQEFVRRIQRVSLRMTALIDDLLLFSRIGRAEMRRFTVDLSDIAREIADELQKGEPGRDTSFTIAEGMSVKADPQLMRIAMENLLGNAWKYTGKTVGARIEVGMREENGIATYFVRDNGAGFDMAHSDKLFKAFERLHPSCEFEGTGIGLSTVQRIIDRHGGRIWAHGEVGRGAEFRFYLGGD